MTRRTITRRRGEEAMKTTAGGAETIKMLMIQSLEGTIKALKERTQDELRNVFKVKESTAHVLFFHYLHLRLRLIGRSMQTCK